MKLNFVTVCTGHYPIDYAKKIIKRVNDLSVYDFDNYCITDRPDEIKRYATPIKPLYEGWWNKPMAFDIGKNEWTLYLDIDIVVRKNFDEEIAYAMSWPDHISLVEDAIRWMDNDLSTSLMIFRKGQFSYINERLARDTIAMDLPNFAGGDQVWIGKFVKPQFHKLNIKFPNLKKNLKFDLGEKVFNRWQFPKIISHNIKMVDCGGRPKPHDLQDLDYIKTHWHDIKV